jgi:hypothetical protein
MKFKKIKNINNKMTSLDPYKFPSHKYTEINKYTLNEFKENMDTKKFDCIETNLRTKNFEEICKNFNDIYAYVLIVALIDSKYKEHISSITYIIKTFHEFKCINNKLIGNVLRDIFKLFVTQGEFINVNYSDKLKFSCEFDLLNAKFFKILQKICKFNLNRYIFTIEKLSRYILFNLPQYLSLKYLINIKLNNTELFLKLLTIVSKLSFINFSIKFPAIIYLNENYKYHVTEGYFDHNSKTYCYNGIVSLLIKNMAYEVDGPGEYKDFTKKIELFKIILQTSAKDMMVDLNFNIYSYIFYQIQESLKALSDIYEYTGHKIIEDHTMLIEKKFNFLELLFNYIKSSSNLKKDFKTIKSKIFNQIRDFHKSNNGKWSYQGLSVKKLMYVGSVILSYKSLQNVLIDLFVLTSNKSIEDIDKLLERFMNINNTNINKIIINHQEPPTIYLDDSKDKILYNTRRFSKDNMNSYFGTYAERSLTKLYDQKFKEMTINDLFDIISNKFIDYSILDAYNMDFIMVCFKRFMPYKKSMQLKFIKYILKKWIKLSGKVHTDNINKSTFMHYLVDNDYNNLISSSTNKCTLYTLTICNLILYEIKKPKILTQICNYLNGNAQTFLEYIIIKFTDRKVKRKVQQNEFMHLIKLVALVTKDKYMYEIYIPHELTPNHKYSIMQIEKKIKTLKSINPIMNAVLRMQRSQYLFDKNILTEIFNLLINKKYKLGFIGKKNIKKPHYSDILSSKKSLNILSNQLKQKKQKKQKIDINDNDDDEKKEEY